MDKIVVSKPFDWKGFDTKAVLTNALKFAAPLGLMYVTKVIGGITNAGGALSLEAFTVNSFLAGAMTLYVLNAAYNALTRFVGADKYVMEK